MSIYKHLVQLTLKTTRILQKFNQFESGQSLIRCASVSSDNNQKQGRQKN